MQINRLIAGISFIVALSGCSALTPKYAVDAVACSLFSDNAIKNLRPQKISDIDFSQPAKVVYAEYKSRWDDYDTGHSDDRDEFVKSLPELSKFIFQSVFTMEQSIKLLRNSDVLESQIIEKFYTANPDMQISASSFGFTDITARIANAIADGASPEFTYSDYQYLVKICEDAAEMYPQMGAKIITIEPDIIENPSSEQKETRGEIKAKYLKAIQEGMGDISDNSQGGINPPTDEVTCYRDKILRERFGDPHGKSKPQNGHGKGC